MATIGDTRVRELLLWTRQDSFFVEVLEMTKK
jgi:hypothetical protein